MNFLGKIQHLIVCLGMIINKNGTLLLLLKLKTYQRSTNINPVSFIAQKANLSSLKPWSKPFLNNAGSSLQMKLNHTFANKCCFIEKELEWIQQNCYSGCHNKGRIEHRNVINMADAVIPNKSQKYYLSFAGCGFLGIYHLGVVRGLIHHGGDFLSQVDRFAGASAGALVAAALAIFGTNNQILQDCENFCRSLATTVKDKRLGVLTPGMSLLEPLEGFLKDMIPGNAYCLASGRLYVSVTSKATRENLIISEFHDNEDLVQKYLDGGLSNNLPFLPGARNIMVSPFCGMQDICPQDKKGFGWHLDVSQQSFKVNRLNIVRGMHAFFPPSNRKLEKYYTLGKENAKTFLHKENLYVENESTHL